MRVLKGRLRTAFLTFFISHIPITILIDGQGAFSKFYPPPLQNLVAWYTDLSGDVLMGRATSHDNVWFSSVILCELTFQLPFFFVCVKMILSYPETDQETPSSYKTTKNGNITPRINHVEEYPSWFRAACIIYGAHVSTTLVPILATFVMSQAMTITQKCSTILCTFGRRDIPKHVYPFGDASQGALIILHSFCPVYMPYLILPLTIMYLAAREDFISAGDAGSRVKSI
jgi:hypothetical protein